VTVTERKFGLDGGRFGSIFDEKSEKKKLLIGRLKKGIGYFFVV